MCVCARARTRVRACVSNMCITICVNCDVCECVNVYYKYNITLHNLIQRFCCICVYCYHIIITFYYKVSDTRKKKRKRKRKSIASDCSSI